MERFGHSHILAILAFLAISLAIAGFVVTQLSRRRTIVLFFLSWFAITLAPVLPLTNHRADYYLTIPVAPGWQCWARLPLVNTGTRAFHPAGYIVLPVRLLFLMSPGDPLSNTHWWLERSLSGRTLALGVIAARHTHQAQVIVLDGVTTDLYNLSYAHSPFFALGIDSVYLTPESALTIHPARDAGELAT